MIYIYIVEMIIIATLIYILSPHVVTIFRVVRAPEIYSLAKFPVFNTVLLTIIIMLYIREI